MQPLVPSLAAVSACADDNMDAAAPSSASVAHVHSVFTDGAWSDAGYQVNVCVAKL